MRVVSRLKQRETVRLQLVQGRHASDEQDQKFLDGPKGLGLVLVDEQKQNRPDKADSERVKDIGIHVPCKCRRRSERYAAGNRRNIIPATLSASMRIMSAGHSNVVARD